MEINELSRNRAVEVYKTQGYGVKGRIIKGKEYKVQLYSLFWARFKQTLDCDNPQKLVVLYADMLEVLQSLMKHTKTKFKNNLADPKYQAMQWYKDLSPLDTAERLKGLRIDLMQKFQDLMMMKK